MCTWERRGLADAYPIERVESVLSVLIANNGHQRKTAEITGVSQTTICHWIKGTHKDLYHELLDQHQMEIEARIVAELHETALDAVEVVKEGVKQTKQQLEEGKVKDVAKATRDMAWVAGNSVEKVLQLTGRAQKVAPGSGGAEGMALVDALVSRGILKVSEPVEGEAVEDAQLAVGTNE